MWFGLFQRFFGLLEALSSNDPGQALMALRYQLARNAGLFYEPLAKTANCETFPQTFAYIASHLSQHDCTAGR